jgi:hypothetical protein
MTMKLIPVAFVFMIPWPASVAVSTTALPAAFLCSSDTTDGGTPLAEFTVCRAATTDCDVAELCDGVSLNCPQDAFAAATKVIHASTSQDACDPTETCSGEDDVMPINEEDCVRVAIDILGQSGKFSIFDSAVGKSDPNKVTIEVDALRELAADGVTSVGASGKVKHSLQTFANQDFTIEDPVDEDVATGVHAQKVVFSTPVNSIGTLELQTFILKSGGTIGTDTESWEARANDVKFNIKLSDWSFCGDAGVECGQGKSVQVGTFIDVDVKIKGKASSPTPDGEESSGSGDGADEEDTLDDGTEGEVLIADESGRRSRKASAAKAKNKDYDLGGGVPLQLSDRVLVDGVWASMPEGFPKMVIKGGSAIFTFRFPKFNDSAVYDPVIGFSESLESTGNTAAGLTISSIAVVVALSIAAAALV